MSRKAVTTSSGVGSDEGSALIAVIGVMAVLTVLAITIISTSLFNVRTTTETRASVQARAAAEAGIAYVREQLSRGVCTSGQVDSPAGFPKFTVTIHPSSAATATSALPRACPDPASPPSSIVLVATGTAASSGVGSSSGNSRKVEALLEPATGAAPKFTAAIYSGTDASLNILNLSGSGADVVTGGNWYCSSEQTIEGSIYAAKDVIFQSGPCGVNGSVYAGANFKCTSPSVIGGHLYVQEDAQIQSVHCAAGGDVWIGGNVSESRGIKAGGNLAVRGNLPVDGPSIQVAGSVNIGGKIAGGFGDQDSWFGKFAAQYPNARQDQVVGMPPSGSSATSMEFPRLSQSSDIWTGFSNRSWKLSVEPLLKPDEDMSVCWMDWGTGVFAGPLDVTENTSFDATDPSECSGNLGLGSGLTIRLGADAVIFSNKFSMTGDIRVESLDGMEHSLYIVTPFPAAQTSCSTPVGTSSIMFPWGTWTQDNETSVMLYSAGSINFTSSPNLRGQIYGCSFGAGPRLDLEFSQTGATETDPSAAKLSVKYVRDVAN